MPNIIFKAKNEYVRDNFDKPYPASKAIPDWWREHSPYVKDSNNPDGKKLLIRNGLSNATFKKCVPMLDGLTSGYIIPTWFDVQVLCENNVPEINWTVTYEPLFDIHGKDSNVIRPPHGFYDQLFIYRTGWIPRTPKGYSVLITHPFGYSDSPFRALSAVVDSDENKTEISLPFWVRKDFEGIIEKGLPMTQIIPFKREKWTSSFDSHTNNSYQKEEDKNWRSTLMNHYIKNIWTKKEYK